MSHFWLKPEEQVLMDRATSTAHDYGYIGAFDMGTATKKALLALLGYEARAEDQIRPHKLVNRTKFYIPDAKANMSAKVLVRMNKQQAMMLKLKHQPDSIEARLYDDPTGEFWGNLLVAQAHLPQTSGWGSLYGYECRWDVISGLRVFLCGEGFGPTLATVAGYAGPLPEEWKAAFVRHHFEDWGQAAKPCELHAAFGDKRHLLDDATASHLFDGIFQEPITYRGQRWATTFWQDCQNVAFRKRLGIA